MSPAPMATESATDRLRQVRKARQRRAKPMGHRRSRLPNPEPAAARGDRHRNAPPRRADEVEISGRPSSTAEQGRSRSPVPRKTKSSSPVGLAGCSTRNRGRSSAVARWSTSSAAPGLAVVRDHAGARQGRPPIRSSTSSGLRRSDTRKIPGSEGLNVFTAIKNGGDVERFLTTLHERCWLAGLGWMMVGVAASSSSVPSWTVR